MSEETVDHNTALHSLIETGDEQDVQMILGHKDKLRCGGIIRTGVKVLKKDATAAEIKKFKELEAQGMSYEAIDRELGGNPRTASSKLFPKNVDHFVIRDCDFQRASDAKYIRDHFADTDGKVRSFPIWLSVGDIDKILWHSFKAFNGSGSIIAASFYEGKELMCRYLPKDFKGVPKKEDWLIGKLDADNPVSPAGHKLQFGGIFRFLIPGLRGFDEIFIPTRSYYGIGYSIALLRRVRNVLGRCDGLLNGEHFLCITKVAETVTDPKGNKVTQYIPVIELAIDPMELARHAEKRLERGPRSLAILNGEPLKAPAAFEPPVLPSEPDAMAEGTTDAPQVSPEIAGAIAAIEKLTTAANIPVEHFEAFVAYSKGVSLSALTIEELRKLYAQVKKSVATESAVEDFREHCEQCFEGGQQ